MKLKELQAKAGHPPEMENEDGKAWFERYRRAQDWHEKESWDWPTLSALYQRPYAEVTDREGGVVLVKIPWAKAYLDNLATDLYFRNPDAFVEPRIDTPDDREIARGAGDLARTLDDDLGTIHHVHLGILGWGCHGLAGIWTTHQQIDHTDRVVLEDDYGEALTDEFGEPVYDERLVIDEQRLIEEDVPAHLLRFDPSGTDWLGLSNFKYLFRLYTRSLWDAWNDEDWNKEDRKRLVWFATGHGNRGNSSGGLTSLSYATREEEDCRYIDVTFAEGWSAVERRIVHLPVGARFVMRNAKRKDGEFLWPRGLAKFKRYPLRLISDGYTIQTDTKENHYPVPLLRHVRALIEDYVRIYGRLLAAGDGIVKKYFTLKGVIDRSTFRKFSRGDQSDVHVLDPVKLRDVIGVTEDGPLDVLGAMQKVVAQLPATNSQEEILAYAAQLDRIERIFWQMTGQGPADRGGVAPSATATETVAIASALQKRTSTGAERIADAHDDINEIRFLLLAEHQTLPMPYRASTSAFNETRWRRFDAQILSGLTLSFSHVVGSTRPPTRAQLKTERAELFAKIAPFADAIRRDRTLRKLLIFTLDPYDVPFIETLLEDPLPALAEEIMKLNLAVKRGQVPIEDLPRVAARLKELEVTMADAVLTDADKERIALESGGAGGGGEGGGGMPSAPSGTMASQRATMAAAGMEAPN